jgi:hypothetical protein
MLACALSGASLAAQTSDDAETQTEAELPSTTAEQPDVAVPFGLEVIGGDARSVAANPVGSALPEEARVCLDREQHLTVSANGEAIDYSGPGCFEPRAELAIPVEAYGGSHVWYPLAEDSPGWSTAGGCSAVVVASRGPSAEALAKGDRISADRKIVLEAGDIVALLTARGMRTLVGPGTFASCEGPAALAAALPMRRARFGAVRGDPGAMGGGAAAQRLIATRGTAGAMTKFPRGTVIASPQKVCLAAGDRLTVAGRSGARMTFAGPGCGRRLGTADDDNTPAVSPG